MSFREIAEALGYDPAKATGKVPLEVLREAARLAMESGEPIAVTESNGVITVSPSILCGCGAHYFIEQNKIRWC